MTSRWAFFPFALFVFVLPFPHTTSVRLTCLLVAFLMAVACWRRLGATAAVPGCWPIAVWALVAIASVAYSFDPGYSLSEVKNEVGYALMAYVAFFAFCRDERQLAWLAGALAAATLLIATWGLGGTLQTGLWREDAGHGGGGGVSAFLCVSMPLLLVTATAVEPRHRRWLVAALILGLVAGFATRQRILWPVWLLQFGIASVVLLRLRLIGWSRKGTVIVAAVAVAVAIAGLVGTQKWRTDTGQIRAVDSRQAAWPAVVDRVLEQPLKGVGFGRQAMRKGYPELFSQEDVLFWHAHNMFLNAAISMGIPGALAMLVLFAWFGYLYLRLLGTNEALLQRIGVAGLLLLVGVVGRNLTNDFFVRDGALLFWALNGALLGVACRRQRSPAA
jgi:O-antigen ligase